MLNRKQKEKVVKQLTDSFSRAKTVVFTDFQGLKVSEIEEMRKKLREEESEYKAAKKNLIKIALKNAEFDISSADLNGSIGVAFSYNDEVKIVKTVYDFARINEKLKIVGGIFNKNYIEREKIKNLAMIPSKEELLAKLAATINNPVNGFVNVMAGNLRSLVYVFKAISNK